MDNEKHGGPAFGYGDYTNGGNEGMSLREYYAGQATWEEIEHILRTVMTLKSALKFTPEEIAEARFIFADAMIKERNKIHD